MSDVYNFLGETEYLNGVKMNFGVTFIFDYFFEKDDTVSYTDSLISLVHDLYSMVIFSSLADRSSFIFSVVIISPPSY